MNRWVDVNEEDWFFNEVMEASNIVLEDGKTLIQSTLYNYYDPNAPYLYEEQKVGVTGKKVFTLSKKITPTDANPLFVYIDGVQTIYSAVDVNASGTTDVTLYAAPKKGALLSFASAGKPMVDRFGKPQISGPTPTYPQHTLDHGSTYHYAPFTRQYQEYLYAFGRPLKRVNVPEDSWKTADGQTLAKRHIGSDQDKYIVAPAKYGGIIYLPYNLSGVTCKFVYNSKENGVVRMRGGEFKATGTNVYHNDRFFPDAYITRGEAFLLMERLRQTFYSRFTDTKAPNHILDMDIVIEKSGQRTVSLPKHLTMAQQKSLAVKVGNYNDAEVFTGTEKYHDQDFTFFDSHTMLFHSPLSAGMVVRVFGKKSVSLYFADVGTTKGTYDETTGETAMYDGSVADDGTHTPSWWAVPVLAMEDERFNNGDLLVQGIRINLFNSGLVVVDHMNNPVGSGRTDIAGTDYFAPYKILTRAECAAFLNRFRKWAAERFR